MVNWPKITLVTPNYNQGKYLEKCILSVIDQNYPNLEYFIYDGKSTDNSIDIIKRYEDKISYWTSKPDKGQTDAINKGLEKATGQIFNWLNADDYLEPNALQKVVAAYQMNPDAAAWIGSCRIVDTMGNVEKVIMPNGLEREHIGHNWNGMNFYQPSCFMSREKICKAGGLNISLNYCMDFELYLRLIEKQHFSVGTGIWANALKHPDAKTQKTLNQCYLEVIDVQKNYGFYEGAKNRYERRFGKGRLDYIMPTGLKERLKNINNGSHRNKLSEIPTSFYRRKNICFLGHLDSPPEFESFIHFLKNIFPLILKRNPSIEIHIYNDTKRDIVNRLGQKNLKIFNNINEFKKAAYQSKLCVIPLCFEKGLIDDFKIAASMGVPIVTTTHGVSGYKVKDGLECFITNEDNEFAEKCNQLISDPSTWGNFSARLLLMMFDGDEPSHSCSNGNNRKAFKGTSYENRKHVTIIQGGFPALSATFILDQMTGLIDRGYEIENWPTYNPNENGIHPDVFKYCLLNRTRYLKLPNDSLRSKPEIWTRQFAELNNLERLNYSDIFHVHYGSNFNLLEPLFRYFPNKFIVVSFHGHDASRYFKKNGDNCYKYLFERADFITTPSFTMKNELINRGCRPDKVQVHRYGVDLKKFNPDSKNHNISHIRLLTVARLVEKKGIEYSLKAVATLDNIEKIKYRIIGEGPLKEYLQNVAKNLGIENCVKFIGGKTKNEVIKEMSIADIFLLNSVTAKDGDMEGVPVSLIEAQAMGLPVVSSYHAGIPELVIDGETGFLAEEKNISQIAAGLEKLIDSTQLRNTFSDNAKRRIKAEFDIERLNDKLKSYFEIGIRSSKYRPPQFSNKRAEYSCSIRCKKEQEKLALRPIDKENDRTAKKDFSHKLIKSIAEIKACFHNLNWGKRLLAYERSFEYAEVLDGSEPSEISIIIICEKYSNDLRRNLEAINKQRHNNFQLILVNNGSKDYQLSDLKSYIDVYIKLNTNTGAYFSRNIGTLFANAPILLFLDDDGIPETNLIKAHLDAFKKYNVVAVRGVCLPKAKNHLNKYANHYYLGDLPFPRYSDLEGNSAYDSKIFYKVGGWDDEIYFGGGGIDLAIRLMSLEPNMCKQIYSPDPVIFHDYAIDEEHLKKKRQKQFKSFERLRRKHQIFDSFQRAWDRFTGHYELIPRRITQSGHGVMDNSKLKNELLDSIYSCYQSGDMQQTAKLLGKYQQSLKQGIRG